MRLIAAQFADELVKLFARRRTYIGFGAFVALQAMILALLQHPRARRSVAQILEQNGLGFDDHYMGLTLGIVVIAFSFSFLGGLYVALVAGDIVAKEVEDGTMRMILSRPVGRVRMLLIKFAACVLYTLTLVWFLGVTALVFASLYRGGPGKLFIFFPDEELFAFYDTAEGLWRYVRSIGCLSFATLTIAAMGFMFSCFKMKPAAATILTLSVLFVDVVLMNLPYFAELRHWFMSYHIGFWVRTYHAYPPWAEITQSVAWLVGLMSTFVIVGVTHFAGRDLKA